MFLRCLALLLALGICAPAQSAPDIFAHDNLVAWCIVPFDAQRRGPEERAAMLEKIGIKRFAYDYRAEHIPTWDAELDALQRHHIELTAWWFPGQLNEDAQKALALFQRHGVKPQLWVSGGGAPTKDAAEQAARVETEAKRIKTIAEAAAPLGLQVALYNHGGWYGEPENQLEIIARLQRDGITNVGLVYNLHHGHDHLDRLPQLIEKMKPHLLAFNLNGMTRGGEMILPLGQGELDLSLLKLLRDSGWRGPVGLLNHTSEDAEARLLDNRDGLDWLVAQLDGKPAGQKPTPRSWKKSTPPPPSISSGVPSLSPAFGTALTGGMLVEGQPAYHELPLTIECRAKLNGAHGFNILAANDPKKSAEHWELYTFSGSGLFSVFQPGRGGSVSGGANICDGQWHALAAVLEVTRVRLYVDGKLVKDAPCPPLNGQAVAGGLAFGRLVEGTIGCDGAVDDVRISKGVREISAPTDAPLPKDAQTLGLWNFDDLTARNPAPTPQANVPETFTIPAAKTAELTRANGWPKMDDYRTWDRSLGGPTSNRFSALTAIDKSNVAKLELAWTYHSGDGKANIQCNPIIVDGVMYAPTAGWNIVALEATTGTELWRFNVPKEGKRLEDQPARRGLLYWKGDARNPARVIFGAGNWLYALDPKTGKVLANFGENGRTNIPTATSTVAAIYQNVLVAAGYLGDVFGYDVRTGALLWTFKTKPDPGQYGSETWSRIEDGANCWGGMALDESRGIAFVSTGSPKPNYLGMGHLGDNLFGDCVIALDALTGKRLWHFQEVRHDIWDWDIPAPPNLVTVERDGVKVDAVAQVTKLGNTLLLDRVTGQPLYDYRLVRVATRSLPGDQPAPMQPMPELPQPFARQAYTMADLPAAPEAQAVVLPVVQRANSGPYPSIEEAKPTLLFNIHGGAEWTGASFDPRTGRLYVTANEIPWFVTCFRDSDPEPLKPPTEGEKVYQSICFACHGPDRKGIGHAPPLRGVRLRLSEAEIRSQLKNGKGSMPPMAQLTEEQIKPLLDFLLCRDRPIPPVNPNAPVKWTFGGWNRLIDHEGYPGCKPPWGTLTCLDLNTGRIAWKVPFGEYPELAAKGVPKTGQENFGGCMVTATGLVIAGGTRDQKLRAFDSGTGTELWSYQLPLHSTAPPASYEAGGRQFIVVPVTGGGKLGGPTGDAWMAFALPK
ncbi:MAG: PQQ-binding-like beta-propeller repeat protein [Chthoniobacter sp.]|uniref:outer membrane protein assembly factor BamB family protein n=1 Tax=Chthoniobacter sp. TaxID=2510640 RepID=UPI0032A75626